MYYTDGLGKSVPINYRIYNKQEGKTKNDYLQEMIAEVLAWGLQPSYGDYRRLVRRDNLKFLKDKDLGLLMGVAKNRSVSINGRDYTQVQNLEIPDEGLIVHLKSFSNVKVFYKTPKS